MPALFFFLPLILLFLLFYLTKKSSFRTSLIQAVTFFGLITYTLTEVLGFFHKLSFSWVLGSWVVLSFLLAMLLDRRYRTSALTFKKKFFLPSLKLEHKLLITPLVIVAVGTLFLAVYVPPNNWDSMTYHLPRIEHWIQNQSLEFYPTQIERQLYVNPLPEILMLHLRVLTSSDLLVNTVQWFAMIVSVLGVSMIAQLLGANTRQQLITALFAISIPMGIFQSTSTQTDYVVTMYLVCFALFFLEYLQSHTLKNLLYMSVALGLAFLSKPTAYFFALPFLIWLFIDQWPRQKMKLVRTFAIIATIVLSIIGSHHLRNIQLYRSPFGGTLDPKYTLINPRPVQVVSNLIKNLSMQLVTPSVSVNSRVVSSVVFIHERILNTDINDELTTWPDQRFGLNSNVSEDNAGGPFHILLILCCLPFLLLPQPGRHRAFHLAIFAGLLLSLGFLRWQPWGTKLQLQFIVLLSVFVGITVGKLPRIIVIGAVILLSFHAGYFLLNNPSKLVHGYGNIFHQTRSQMVFYHKPYALNSYEQAVNYIARQGIDRIGLRYYGDSWEYPLWRMLNQDAPGGFQIINDDVQNITKQTIRPTQPFEAVVCLFCSKAEHVRLDAEFAKSEVFGEEDTISVHHN